MRMGAGRVRVVSVPGVNPQLECCAAIQALLATNNTEDSQHKAAVPFPNPPYL